MNVVAWAFLGCGWPVAPLAGPRFPEGGGDASSPPCDPRDTATFQEAHLPSVLFDGPPLEATLVFAEGALGALAVEPTTQVGAELSIQGLLEPLQVGVRLDVSRGLPWLDVGLDLDAYHPGAELDGLDALELRYVGDDPTRSRMRASLELHRRMGVPAPRANLVWLTVGSLDPQPYLLTEGMDGRFIERWFDDPGLHLRQGPRRTPIGGDPYDVEALGGNEREREALVALYEVIEDPEFAFADLQRVIDQPGWSRYHATWAAQGGDGTSEALATDVRDVHLFASNGRVTPLAWGERTSLSTHRHPMAEPERSLYTRRCLAHGGCEEEYTAALWEAARHMGEVADVAEGWRAALGAREPVDEVAWDELLAFLRERADVLENTPGLLPEEPPTWPVGGITVRARHEAHRGGVLAIDVLGAPEGAHVELFLGTERSVRLHGDALAVDEAAWDVGMRVAGARGVQERRGIVPHDLSSEVVVGVGVRHPVSLLPLGAARRVVPLTPAPKVEELHPGLTSEVWLPTRRVCVPREVWGGSCRTPSSREEAVGVWTYAATYPPSEVRLCGEVEAPSPDLCCWFLGRGCDRIGPPDSWNPIVWW